MHAMLTAANLGGRTTEFFCCSPVDADVGVDVASNDCSRVSVERRSVSGRTAVRGSMRVIDWLAHCLQRVGSEVLTG